MNLVCGTKKIAVLTPKHKTTFYLIPMLKKTSILLVISLAAASFSFGSSYVGFTTGYLDDVKEPIWSVQVGVKQDTENKLQNAVELEFAYTIVNYGILGYKADVKYYSGMLNLKSSIDFNDKVSGYVGAGGGVTRLDSQFIDDNVFSFQIMLGIEIEILPTSILRIGVRRLVLDDVFNIDDLYDSGFEAGVVLKF